MEQPNPLVGKYIFTRLNEVRTAINETFHAHHFTQCKNLTEKKKTAKNISIKIAREHNEQKNLAKNICPLSP